MSFNDEKRILVRLLKKKGNYRINEKIIKTANERCRVFDVIDIAICWHDEIEGYFYFYYLQLDLISLLCENNLCEEYLNYYRVLLNVYGNGGVVNKTDKYFLMHKDMYKLFSLKMV